MPMGARASSLPGRPEKFIAIASDAAQSSGNAAEE
jgi:hypothetical protein